MHYNPTFAGAVLLTCGLFVTAVLSAGQHNHGEAAVHSHGDAAVHSHGAAVRPVQMAQMKPAPPGPLPPLPYSATPPVRPMAVVQTVYEFAARHPEVLRYVPCYCGCEREGHSGNHDCFVRSRDANGRVTWDVHGLSCAVCLDVGREAMQMFNSGASVTAIRAAIEQKYTARFPSKTPTPVPPKSSAPVKRS